MKNETQNSTKTETVIPILPSHPDSMNIGSHPDSTKTETVIPNLPDMPIGKDYAVVDVYPEPNLENAYPEFFLWERSAELECYGRNVAYAGCDVNIVAVTLTRKEYEKFCKRELTIE